MKKLLMLLVLVVIVAAAPMAMADHCVTCRNARCSIAFTGGYLSCTQLANGCSLSGACGGPHPFVEEEEWLSAEFTVASVERLDEPQQPAASETLVASLETAPQQDVRR